MGKRKKWSSCEVIREGGTVRSNNDNNNIMSWRERERERAINAVAMYCTVGTGI